MPEVINISDRTILVPTREFEEMKFPFEFFNPVQSRLFEVYEGNSNVVIAAQTAAGKTCCAEMYISHELQKRGGKAVYIGPMKALAKEKQEDWTSIEHDFAKHKVSLCTGDFKLTENRRRELDSADIILMTPEMLSVRTRNNKSEKSNFLSEIGTLVFDESHLISVPNRGDHIEVALMKIIEIAPHARIVMLSATMPNVKEICEWLTEITGRDTYCLESSYRPVPLNIHYNIYQDKGSYDDKENEKSDVALDLIQCYGEDKFLVFVHTKRTGELMKKKLQRLKINTDFYNADLSLDKRLELENKFKTDDGFRVLVSTSGLAWGVNLPSRRVIVLGIHRGISEVENYDIKQMVGRSGRPKYDDRGDAHILIPASQKNYYITKLGTKQRIESKLLEFIEDNKNNRHYKTLAFHIVSEIHRGGVQTKEDFYKWYSKSFAHFQCHDFDDGVVDKTLKDLLDIKAIVFEDDVYKATAIGMIASMFYYSPFDVADLRTNFGKLFFLNQESNDFYLSMALGNIDTNKWGIVNRAEKEEMSSYQVKIRTLFDTELYEPAIKAGYGYYCLLKGKSPPTFISTIEMFRNDSERLLEVVSALDNMSGKWGKIEYLNSLKMRLKYGVEEHLVGLCGIVNIGKARAEKLWNNDIKDFDSIIKSGSKLIKLLKISQPVADKIIDHAKELKLKEMIG